MQRETKRAKRAKEAKRAVFLPFLPFLLFLFPLLLRRGDRFSTCVLTSAFGAASGFSCEYVSAAGLYFDVGIWVSLDHFFEFKSGLSQTSFHRFGLKEIKIQRHGFIPPLVQVYI